VFLKGLECYSESGLDFVDALLLAYHLVESESVFTFDDKLNKYLRRATPRGECIRPYNDARISLDAV
jgi:hypothetical protein